MHNQWSKFYKQYGRFYLLPHPELEKAIDLFKEDNLLNILDIGCGSGRHLIRLGEENFNVTGIDFSPAAAHEAEEWLHEKGYVGKVYIGDYRFDLKSFKENEFDAAISVNSLHYLDIEREFEDIVKEISRVLKPSGKLFLVLPSKHTLIMQPAVTQIFIDENNLRSMVSAYFTINELYQSKSKEWVLLASNNSK